MKIALACDHRGYVMKENLISFLKGKKHEVTDCGTFSEASADYPDFILEAAEKVGKGICARAIGICYTGIGSSIIANKVRGVRAALCRTVKEAELSRLHNDANMLIIGAGFIESENVFPMIETWLNTPFEGDRHERRVNKIKDYEQKHSK